MKPWARAAMVETGVGDKGQPIRPAQLSRLLTLSLCCVLVLPGCTTQRAGSPSPDPAGSTDTSSSATSGAAEPTDDDEVPSNGAPKVENPVDASRFEQSPCEVLSPGQAQSLGLPTTGEPIEDALGKGCRWHNRDTRGRASIYFSSSDERGLSSVYQEAETSGFPFFEEIDDLEGHPAVAFNPAEESPTVECTVVVGVSDQLVFGALVGLPADEVGKGDPCASATRVASSMMRTMKEAS